MLRDLGLNYRGKAKLVADIRLKLLKPTSPPTFITLETAQTTRHYYRFYLFHTLILRFIFEYSYYRFACEVWIQDYQLLAFACYRTVHTFIDEEILEFQRANNLDETLPVREPIEESNEPLPVGEPIVEYDEPLPVGEPIVEYNEPGTDEETDRERQAAAHAWVANQRETIIRCTSELFLRGQRARRTGRLVIEEEEQEIENLLNTY